MSDYLEQLTSFICSCKFEDLPGAVVERAREVVADSLAVIAAGAQEEEVKNMTARMVPRDGREVATVIGTTQRTEPAKAALINGTAGTFLELDEGNQFGRGHPGIHVIPAALAVSEEKSFSGRDFLTALVLGYEIGTRIGIACKLRMSMHPHGTWGTVGAAVAVAKLNGYDKAKMRGIINVSSSLGLATSRKTILEGGTIRNVYAGVSNSMGILAHDLVQSGFTGEADGLRTVFGSVVSDTFRPEVMVEDLGTRYEIARNYFKRYACCRYNHGTLDALGEIVAKRALKPEEITRVDVETYSLAAQLCDQNPQNMLAGKFSVPFAVATAIVHGSTGVESFRPQVVHDPAVKDLAHRVFVTEDPKLTAMMPKFRPSKVKVKLRDGSALEAEALTNKGDTEDPYSGEELRAKYFDLARLTWKREVAEAIHADVMKLETLSDLHALTGKLRKLD
jgi:2-methylcitrate dehydratase PrpD